MSSCELGALVFKAQFVFIGSVGCSDNLFGAALACRMHEDVGDDKTAIVDISQPRLRKAEASSSFLPFALSGSSFKITNSPDRRASHNVWLSAELLVDLANRGVDEVVQFGYCLCRFFTHLTQA